jgi:hypothetical protein
VCLRLPLHDSPTQAGSYTQVYLQAALMLVGTATFIAADLRHRRRR